MEKNWHREKELKKLDRKIWEKTGARPKTNTFIANSSSGAKNHWYQPLLKISSRVSKAIKI